jgi:hypothetical protein
MKKPDKDDVFYILRGKKSTLDSKGSLVILDEKDEDWFEGGLVTGFALSCIKKLAEDKDNKDSIILELHNEIDKLKENISSLTTEFSKLKS